MNLVKWIWLAALVCAPCGAAPAASNAAFVTVKGTHFSRDDRPYYIAGANMWYGGYLGSEGQVGDRKRLARELDTLQGMGINNLRVLAVSERSPLNSAVHPATTNGFGAYDEHLFAGLDFLLAEMGKRHMTAVLYLNNFWQWSGGMTQYMAWVDGKPAQDPNLTNDYEAFMARSASFYRSSTAQDEYRKTIARIVNRVNTVTGQTYSSDPTVMSWQLANEPRPGNSKTSSAEKAIYQAWVNDTAKFIHELDNHHLVSVGSEGEMGAANELALWAAVHKSVYVDYMTYHLWIRNWGWFDQHKPEQSWAQGLARGKAYLDKHIDIARQVGKPLVLEEFGLDRDLGEYRAGTPTRYRDRFYREVFELLYQRAKAGAPIAGTNFWAWNGAARTGRPDFWWHDGDDLMGDPPQEQQGMYGVFDSDTTTIRVIKEYAAKMRALSGQGELRSALVDPQASVGARAVYGYLHRVWGKKLIAGQQDLTWNDSVDMAQRVFDDTGKYPALMGFDFMNYGMTGPSVQGVHQTEEAIAFARRGGLVSFCWHWRDPALLKTSLVNHANFYAHDADPAKNTAFSIPIAQGKLDSRSPAYRQIDDGIDLIAAQLKKLAEAGVPVLWRPLHEAAGNRGDGWFWWGRARTDGVPQAQAYVLLWRHMYDRLVNVHGLHNLIWVWNGQDPAWYPGDDVVDIIGYDIYDRADRKTYRSQVETYAAAKKIPGEEKPIALTETSYIPDPDKVAADGAWWLWFMVWNDAHAPAGVADPSSFWSGDYYNTQDHKRKVYSHPNVVTLDQLPSF